MDTRTNRRGALAGGIAALAAGVTSFTASSPAAAATDALTTRGAEPDGNDAAFGTLYAQRELFLDLRDLYLETDGTTTYPGSGTRVRDYSAAMRRALALASAPGALATIAIPSGVFVLEPFTIDRPIRLLGLGSPTARYGQPDPTAGFVWGGSMLVPAANRRSAPLLTVDSHGVTIEGVSFDGRGSNSPGIHVHNGFELRILRSRIINFETTALLIDHANNAVFDTVHVNNAGSGTGHSAVVINSTPLDVDGMPNGTRTNTLDFRSLTIEQSRATALEIGVDPEKNRADRAQHPEYLRFSDLHIESTSHTGTEDEYLPQEPALLIGALYSATFTAPFIYGGPGPVIRQDASGQASSRSTGITLIGGTLRGQSPQAGATPTLIDLRKGDEFRLLGTRLTQFTRSPISIGAEYGATVQIDSTSRLGAAPGSPAGTPAIDDRRTAGAALSRNVIFGPLQAVDQVQLNRGIEAQSRAVRVQPSGPHVVTIEADRSCDEVRGRVIFQTGPNPSAGAQVRIELPQSAPYRISASAHVTPSDAAGARLLPFAQLRPGADANELWFCLSSTPAPSTRYGFYYWIIG